MIAEIVEELLSDGECASCKLHVGLARRGDLVDSVGKDAGDVFRVRRCANRRNSADFIDGIGDCQDRSTAERVPNQELWGLVRVAEPLRGSQNIVGVRREVRVGELAVTLAEAGEVEAQDTKP